MVYTDYFKEPNPNSTFEEKMEIINYNNLKAKELLKEYKALAHAKVKPHPEEPIVAYQSSSSNFPSSSLNLKELTQQLSLLDISDLTDDEASFKMAKILGTNNLNSKLLALLKLALFNEITEYQKMFILASTNEEQEEIRIQIADLRRKQNLLEYTREEEVIKESSTKENNLYFLSSSLGNIYFLESIRKNVPQDYYQSFKDLLLSIKNGTFKGLKKLTDIPYFEVKDFKIRITFDHLEGNNFIILDAFMKKADTSLQISNSMANRRKQITEAKEQIKKSLNDPEFQALHYGYYQDILAFLDEKNNSIGGRL